jgi:Uma2 family endonuclease
MNILVPPEGKPALPDHTQLPDKDGTFVNNFLENPQSFILTDSLKPVLRRLHPDAQYCIGHDCGIYWRLTDPPLLGCKAPDWFYVPNVPPMLGGQYRRSFVLWQEGVAPLVAIEYVSGDGSEERDQTPQTGKFWVYERAIRIPYYAIYEVDPGRVEVHRLIDGLYQPLPANERGHYPIAPLGVELGIWQGRFDNMEVPWLRWWDAQGNLLPLSEEREQLERQARELERQAKEETLRLAEQEKEQLRRLAEQERQEKERLAARLRALGIDPDSV